MTYLVDFVNVATTGLVSSPVAPALAGLPANEARYFANKYAQSFRVEPANKAKKAVALVARILKEEREIVISSPALEATSFQVENIRWTYLFYQSGLSINVLYTPMTPHRNEQWDSSFPRAWRFQRNSVPLSSRDKSPSSRE